MKRFSLQHSQWNSSLTVTPPFAWVLARIIVPWEICMYKLMMSRLNNNLSQGLYESWSNGMGVAHCLHVERICIFFKYIFYICYIYFLIVCSHKAFVVKGKLKVSSRGSSMQSQLFDLRPNCTDVLQETKPQSQSNKFFSNWNFLFWRLGSNYGAERQCYLVLYTTPGLEEFYNTWLHDKGVLLTVKLLKAVTVLHTLRVNFVAFSSRSYQQKRERERKKRGNKIRGQFFLKLYRTREEKEQWKHFCRWDCIG